jgi:hypothetical protein
VGFSAGEGVEKVEGLTIDRFVASDGGGNVGGWPADGAQGAWPWRAWLRRSPGLERARVAWGDPWRPCGATREALDCGEAS